MRAVYICMITVISAVFMIHVQPRVGFFYGVLTLFNIYIIFKHTVYAIQRRVASTTGTNQYSAAA